MNRTQAKQPQTVVISKNDPEPITLVSIIEFAIRHRIRLAVGAVIGALLILVAALIADPIYVARAVFIPQGRRTPSALSGVAAQLGLSLGSADGTPTLGYYADLVTSRGVLSRVVSDSVHVGNNLNARPQQLADLLKAKGRTQGERREKTIAMLRDMIDAIPSTRSGTITVQVTSKWPDVSSDLAHAVLRSVNDFSLQSRQDQASAERKFVEDRLSQARGELQLAEDMLQGFLEKNRQFRESPELTLAYERLNRRVALRQQVLTSLAESYEQSRIDEVRNVPQLFTVEEPFPPLRPESRHILLKIFLGVVMGVALGTLSVPAQRAVQDALFGPASSGKDQD